ncbi:hypothetical protein BJY52DRAFT_1247887 [Lactarius psammicola]|nr:hypothetical protein BJY52DRAFT_1247887 [Lactarius psammicola]
MRRSASGDIRYLRPFIVGLVLCLRSKVAVGFVVNFPGHESSGCSTPTQGRRHHGRSFRHNRFPISCYCWQSYPSRGLTRNPWVSGNRRLREVSVSELGDGLYLNGCAHGSSTYAVLAPV